MRNGWLFLAVAALLTACGSPPAAQNPAGSGPSEQARMVCTQEAQSDIEIRLGLATARPVTPRWAGGVYSCQYAYPNGAFTLSVRDLADVTATTAYFDSQAKKFAQHTPLPALGDAAFTVPDGSVFVRKDNKMLTVDASALPTQFGVPPVPRAQAARGIAIVIMGCWSGS